MPASVLICDDEEGIAWALGKACERSGHRVRVVASGEDAIRSLNEEHFESAFLDIQLPGIDGLLVLKHFQQRSPATAVIVVTAHGNLNTAVQAVAGGAFDYLAKPFDLDQALGTLSRALARKRTDDGPPATASPTEELIGSSAAMQSVYKRIALVAPTPSCVLITGESGTGKELVARAVHAHSPRRGGPFLPVHVSALNPNLVESELFGHVKGAFTGAERNRTGLIALADGGTLFLDELGDIPLDVQAKLLRVVERQEVVPVGGAEPQRMSVRIVSATNADLSAAVAAGTFRHDLFYRLNVYPIHLPPLRDRPDDLPVLAAHFLGRAVAATVSAEAMAALRQRGWPGNVRELRNALEHAAIQARGGEILPEHLPTANALDDARTADARLSAAVADWVRARVAEAPGEPADLYQRLLDATEPPLLADVLARLGGNRLAASRWLGLARATVRKMIHRHGLAAGGPDDGGGD